MSAFETAALIVLVVWVIVTQISNLAFLGLILRLFRISAGRPEDGTAPARRPCAGADRWRDETE